MSTTITLHEQGHTFTAKLNATAMGAPIMASLAGTTKYALIDGLLWWAINRKLEAMVATSMGNPAAADHDEATRQGRAQAHGEQLVHRVFTTPFHSHSDERQAAIVAYINKELPALQPLTVGNPHAATAKAELAELMELCTILHDRINHPAEALRGMDTILKKAA